jgi:hypothetical protein
MNFKKIWASLASLALVFSPLSIYADEGGAVAQSVDGTQMYAEYTSAWTAANSGTEIIMLQDWDLSSRLVVNEGQNVTIDMNGHKMDRHLDDAISDGEVIYLSKSSNLTLKGSTDCKYTVQNRWKHKNRRDTAEVTVGGLVTGGASSNGGGGIHMKAGSQLTLDHVGVMANASISFSGEGGGIHTDGDGCIINLKNKAQVSYNYGGNGGGIYINNEDNYIYMDNSEISYNFANNGAGLYSDDDATRISMNNNSKISNNTAYVDGGGIFFNDSYSLVQSGDSTGSISNNETDSSSTGRGAGIYYAYAYISDNYGEIKNITFNKNMGLTNGSNASLSRGGAIYCKLNNLIITNCTFTENRSDYGGAIYDDGKNMTLDGCTIKNNICNAKAAGVYVDGSVNLNLAGKLIIKDNELTGMGKKTNVYLAAAIWTNAYISGTPEAGSEVWISSAEEGQIGINQTESNGIFFLDDSDSNHLEYSGSDLYKKNGATSSIFGNGNTIVALCVMVGIGIVAIVALVIDKRKKTNA